MSYFNFTNRPIQFSRVLLFVILNSWFSFFAFATVPLDVNDVSYMWPPALFKSDATKLLPLAQLVPAGVFQEIIGFSQGEKLQDQTLPTPVKMPVSVAEIENWYIVSMRIDPCAPGGRSSVPGLEACLQEIRFVAQPFSYDGVWEYYDFAFHIIFQISEGSPQESVLFKELLTKLVELKIQNQAYGIETNGVPLKIHPGFKRAAFRNELHANLLTLLKKYKLRKITFSGAETEEGPWVFFQGLILKQHYQLEPDPTLRHQAFGEITPELPGKGGSINPLPSNKNFLFPLDRGFGPSIAELFYNGPIDLNGPAHLPDSTESRMFKLKDIVAAAENPLIADRTNTDCFSCHTAMSRGMLLGLAEKQNPFKYAAPNDHVTLKPLYLNETMTNFRVFGWFGSRPMISNRAIHESAQVADMIEKLFR